MASRIPTFVSAADRQGAKRAAQALIRGFSWHDAPGGYDYWRRIHKRLLALAGLR